MIVEGMSSDARQAESTRSIKRPDYTVHVGIK